MLAKDDEMSLVPLSIFPLPATHECLSVKLILSPTTIAIIITVDGR